MGNHKNHQVIIYGGIQQNGIVLSVHTQTVNTSMKRSYPKRQDDPLSISGTLCMLMIFCPLSRNPGRRKPGGGNGLKQGNQVFRGKSMILKSLPPPPHTVLKNISKLNRFYWAIFFYIFISLKFYFKLVVSQMTVLGKILLSKYRI